MKTVTRTILEMRPTIEFLSRDGLFIRIFAHVPSGSVTLKQADSVLSWMKDLEYNYTGIDGNRQSPTLRSGQALPSQPARCQRSGLTLRAQLPEHLLRRTPNRPAVWLRIGPG